jgi:chromate reductase
MSVSPSAIGGFGANHNLRQAMVFLNVPMMQQPEAYVGGAALLFDAAGTLTNEGTQKFFKAFIDSFAVWIEKNLAS